MIKNIFTRSFFKNTLKIFISLFIVYHLLVVFTVPHRSSLIYEKLSSYFISYAHTLGIHTGWSFYAPNPTSYFYFEYEVIDKEDQVDDFRWPPSRKESGRLMFNHNRLISHTMFFIGSGPGNLKKYFLPYLCRLHPEAKEISIQAVVENRPHFKKANVLGLKLQLPENKENMKVWYKTSKKCWRNKKSRTISSEGYDEEL